VVTNVKEPPKNFKIPDLDALFNKTLEEKFEKEYPSLPGRRRPRNPQERAKLLEWEKQRDGKKIGKI
jgi:hypothetical protein